MIQNKREIKLAISDIDGTLLSLGETSLDPELFQVIRELKEKGILFVAASGRQYWNVSHLFEEVKDEIMIIGDNGGAYTGQGEVVLSKALNRDLVERVMEVIRQDENCEAAFSCKEGTYVEEGSKDFLHELRDVLKYDIMLTEDFLSMEKPTIKIAIYNKQGAADSIEKYRRLFGEEACVMTSGHIWLDIVPFGVNKGTSLEQMLEELRISPEECVAFGDQWNDVEMLQLVGTSYAMVNAVEGISEYATYETDSVLKELKKLL